MGGDGAQLHLLLLRTNLESATQNCSLVPQTAAGSCWNVGGVWRLFHGRIRGGVTRSSPFIHRLVQQMLHWWRHLDGLEERRNHQN